MENNIVCISTDRYDQFKGYEAIIKDSKATLIVHSHSEVSSNMFGLVTVTRDEAIDEIVSVKNKEIESIRKFKDNEIQALHNNAKRFDIVHKELKLENKEFIKISVDKADARNKLVSLTEKAKIYWGNRDINDMSAMKTLLSKMSTEHLKNMYLGMIIN